MEPITLQGYVRVMRDILTSWAILVLTGMLVLYMGLSFAKLSFDPSVWGEGARYGYVIGSIVWILLMSLFAISKVSSSEE